MAFTLHSINTRGIIDCELGDHLRLEVNTINWGEQHTLLSKGTEILSIRNYDMNKSRTIRYMSAIDLCFGA